MRFKKNKSIIAKVIEQCSDCNKTLQREFQQGDYVFKKSSSCPNCNKIMLIEKIYGEPLEKNPDSFSF